MSHLGTAKTALLLHAIMFIAASAPVSGQQADRSGSRLELTQTDVFGRHGWASTDVSVAGLYLGMSWSEVSRLAKAHGYRLEREGVPGISQPCDGIGSCVVIGSHGTTSLSLKFGDRSEIVEMRIDKIFEGVNSAVERNSIYQQFKHATRAFFRSYSDELRRRAFGKEDRKSVSEFGTCFEYPKLGVTVTVDACFNKSLEEPCSHVMLDLQSPKSK